MAEPEVVVEISIEGLGQEEAEALARALRPDNATAPEGLSVTEHVSGGKVVFVIRAERGVTFGTLRNTVEEILSYSYTLLKSLEAAAKTLKDPRDAPGEGLDKVEQKAG
ncbi:MAG: KEOPS complex subunit Pcc1 [Thermoproteota archaeon]